jgi:hypothetical protein
VDDGGEFYGWSEDRMTAQGDMLTAFFAPSAAVQ